jgi:hypothetical protein
MESPGSVDEEKERRDLQQRIDVAAMVAETTGSIEHVKKALDPAVLLGMMPEMAEFFKKERILEEAVK